MKKLVLICFLMANVFATTYKFNSDAGQIQYISIRQSDTYVSICRDSSCSTAFYLKLDGGNNEKYMLSALLSAYNMGIPVSEVQYVTQNYINQLNTIVFRKD